MNPTFLLVVNREPVRTHLRTVLGDGLWTVIESSSGVDVGRLMPGVDVAVVDLRTVDGFAGLQGIIERASDGVTIAMSEPFSREDAVEAMRRGAFDYVGYPFDRDRLMVAAQKALDVSRLRKEVGLYRADLAREYGIEAIVGASPGVAGVRSQLVQAAAVDSSPVLLIGEHGTGKHLAARVIHANSTRRTRSLLEVTCSGISPPQLASTLFGHERGAFPDARERARGAFERAQGGTVFLDQIGALSPALQAKLLRVLEEGTFTRMGGQERIEVDVRVIAAHARPLDTVTHPAQFRADLYERLTPFLLVLPPLRERSGDRTLLAHHYVGQFNSQLRRDVRGLTDDALALIENYPWPGNVRELRNAIERAMVVVENDRIHPVDLAAISTHGSALFRLPADGVALEEVERHLLMQALERVSGNQTRAGHLLGLNRDQIRYRIEKYGLASV